MKMKNTFCLSISSIVSIFILCGCVIESHAQPETNKRDMETTWSGIPGNSNFSPVDRLAIRSVMEAFASYWDHHQLDNFIDLFTEDAYLIWSQPNDKDATIPLEVIKARARKRFQENDSTGIQQRHLMANCHFVSQSKDSAQIEQYVLMSSIENRKIFKPHFTMVYNVWLKKSNGRWRIYKYKLTPDVDMQLPAHVDK